MVWDLDQPVIEIQEELHTQVGEGICHRLLHLCRCFLLCAGAKWKDSELENGGRQEGANMFNQWKCASGHFSD